MKNFFLSIAYMAALHYLFYNSGDVHVAWLQTNYLGTFLILFTGLLIYGTYQITKN